MATQPDLFAGLRESGLPSTTVHQSRLQLYQATLQPKECRREIEAPWGTAIVKGKLGQRHAALMEAICYCAEDWRIAAETGHIVILVDPYQVRKKLGSYYSHEQIKKMLWHLKEATIEMTIETPTAKGYILGGILDLFEESSLKSSNPLAHAGKPAERSKWRITLNPAYAKLIGQDLRLDYDPAQLAGFKTGVGQAVARHLLTHRSAPNGGWFIDGLIKAVGAASGAGQKMIDRRKDIRADAEAFRALGYAIEGDRIQPIRHLKGT